MSLSITNEFVLLALNKEKKLASLFDHLILVCEISLGLFELTESNIISFESYKIASFDEMIFISENELPEEMNYLKFLHQAVTDSASKTIYDIITRFCTDWKTGYALNYTIDIQMNLADKKVLTEKKKPGAQSEFIVFSEAAEVYADHLRKNLTEDKFADPNFLIIASLLYRTGMLSEYFPEYYCGLINERLGIEYDRISTPEESSLLRFELLYNLVLKVITIALG